MLANRTQLLIAW